VSAVIPVFDVSVCPTLKGGTKLVIQIELGAIAVRQLASLLLVVGARLQSRAR
jgi:hypothetical protein